MGEYTSILGKQNLTMKDSGKIRMDRDSPSKN